MTATACSQRAANFMVVVAFAAMICLPGWKTYRDLLATPRDQLVTLAADPMWRISRTFPGSFEPFFDERFGFRNVLLAWLRHAKLNWLHVSTSQRVALGINGWLFHLPMPAGADHPIVCPPTPDSLECWARMLQARHDWLAVRGIPYFIVIAPDKQSIYPEALPSGLRRRANGEPRLDEVLAYLRENTTVSVIDVRPAILQAKSQEQLYATCDSHWNDRGAHVAYTTIIQALQAKFPALIPMSRADFLEVAQWVSGGDCARLVGTPEHFTEAWLKLVPKHGIQAKRIPVPGPNGPLEILRPFATELPNSNLPRAVMFHDSFGGHVAPFLSEHFQRIVYAWERTDSPIFDSELVLREHPDVVIQQIVERKLAVYCPAPATNGDPRCETAAAWRRCSERAD